MSATATGGLSVAVLAGGRSRRMGADKALLRLEEEGPPLLARVLERVAFLTDDAFVVATDRPAYAQFGVPLVPDLYPGAGALGGIYSALRAARHDAVLVLACDLPFLSQPLLAWMARQTRTYDALVPVLPGQSRQGRTEVFQTLHAIYRRACLEPMARRLDAEAFQVIGFFDDVRVEVVDEATVRSFDPSLRTFFNANTPEALAEARRLAAEGDPPRVRPVY